MSYLKLIKSSICLGLSIFFATAILSYNEMDPSFNRATNADPTNFAGTPGAYFSSSVLQLFGLASSFIVLIPLCWSFVYFYHEKISLWFLRILSVLIVLNSVSLSLSFFHLTTAHFKYTGGAVGLLWLEFLTSYFSKEIILFSSITIFIISLYFAMALSKENWFSIFRFITQIFSYCFKVILRIGKIIIAKFNKANKEDQPFKTKISTAIKTPSQPKKEEIITPRKVMNNPIANGFILPSSNLLKDFPVNTDKINQNNSAIKKNKGELLQVLSDFGVRGDVTGASSGPVVTLYELEPAAGTKSSRIIGLSDDISRSMGSTSARIAVIPGRNAIGIELPNKQRETVYLKELLESTEYKNKNYELPIILGKDISGNVIVTDLARMPHLLVAGTTGSGKSVAINTMILSLLYALPPDQCKFIMVDPKMLELSVYDGIPHLLTNVVTEPGKAVVALKWVVKEMENRYRLMSNLNVRNIHNYNDKIKEAINNGEIIQRKVQTGFDSETGQPKIEQVPLDMKTLPFIVVIVDEMADLMLVAGKDIETSIQRLAQMARAAGIHLIMATQRPSVDVITGVIKANFPTRISFQVTSKIDSRTILGEQGAEQLLGKGDMLFMAGGSKITRIHGPFIADNEVEKVVSYLKTQGTPDYMTAITSEDETSNDYNERNKQPPDQDELYQEAIRIIQHEGKASTSFIQRCLKIGYNRAANIIEQMEKDGLVSKPNHTGKREILI
ncbi:MAG: DNA translocase FtsK 4TM domain-containing protein [Rickettsiales bacterium]|jgi:S-DNA-T family DNA segregation ATPase FtsK/SpoIIIE|nr:DNA translocase FtsK 4TM domain-containing protein [Rickettsiales bacterium]